MNASSTPRLRSSVSFLSFSLYAADVPVRIMASAKMLQYECSTARLRIASGAEFTPSPVEEPEVPVLARRLRDENTEVFTGDAGDGAGGSFSEAMDRAEDE